MSIINTYCINAGRSIAREIDDDSDKSRREAKRRADAAYFADKERLHARVRQMNEQTEQVSADRFTALIQEQRADPQFRISERRSPITANEDGEQAPENLQVPLSTDANSPAIAQSLVRVSRATDAVPEQSSDQDTSPPSANVSGSLANQTEISSATITTLHGSAHGTNTAGTKDLLDRLLNEIDGSSSGLTREGVLSVLERLSQDVNARPSHEVTLKEKEGVIGYLEFLEGYFEKSQSTSGPTQEIAALMASIRAQLGTLSAPMLATGIQNLVMANQADSQTPVHAIHREQRKKHLNANAVSAEEAKLSDLDAYPSAAVLNSVDTGKSATLKKESSLSKDSQRRRDETLVSVTLRSV